ncbi:hypothetical protein ATERTT37_001494 [Aspergillus terreus]
MEELLTQVQTLASSADEPTRSRLITALHDLSISLEGPEESIQRIAVAPLQLHVAKIARDLELFERLSASPSALPVQTLAEATGADVVLLRRLMRYLASEKMVDETGVDVFAANNARSYELIIPVCHKLPETLARTHYANPTDATKVALQDAFDIDGDVWAFFKAFPKYGAMFDWHMQMQRAALTDWARIATMMKERGAARDDEVVFVDIGGGNGHECLRLQAAYPELTGKLVLQDLPEVIARAPEIPGVENMACDIFKPQPVQAARFYYMRGVLHDFPDPKSREILRNTAAAMGPESVLLLDEMVLPDQGVHWMAASMDLQMLAWLASQERTRTQWEELLKSVGMEIVDVYAHRPSAYESLIVVRVANE